MSTWLSHTSKQQRILRKNAFLWCGVFLVLFGVLVLRLLWLQGVHGHFYHELARQYRNRDEVIPAMRGRLLDRNLAVLALDDQRLSLFVDPALAQYPRFVAQQLAPVIGRSEDEIYAALTLQLPFVWVKRNISQATCDAVNRLALPGLQVCADKARYRVGVDQAQVRNAGETSALLGKALDVAPAVILRQLHTDAQARRGAVSGTCWLDGVYYDAAKRAVAELKLRGVRVENIGPGFSLGVTPQLYNRDNPQVLAGEAAALLGPVLGMTPRAVEGRLCHRPRFQWLKRNLTMEMSDAAEQLQGTLFVVEPGKLYGPELDKAAERLERLLSDKHTPSPLSRDELRRRLASGASPGALTVKLSHQKPVLAITRSLAARPIPGVIYGLPGVSLQRERRRQYPYATLASPTLGFVQYGKHIHGVFGLESAVDETLRGIDGREIKEIDARHMTIPERSDRVEPRDGRDVVTTLDLGIQQAAEMELAKAVQAAKAAGGSVLVMDPTTGEILAMASQPSWDANFPAKAPPGHKPLPLVNPIVSNFYEPGSTFKLLPVMASLEEGVIRDGQQVTYCSGAMGVGRRTIHEAHNAHGAVDSKRLLEQSCNIGAAVLAMKLGPTRFLKWCDRLGYGRHTGIELAQESPGYLNRKNVETKITLANMGFGQSLAVTPLQMLCAYSVAANGGFLVRPHLVKTVTLEDGTLRSTPVERTRVCSEPTVKLLRGYLENVVVEGTGGGAAIPGYRVAGKTGTAQKPGEHGYGGGRYIASFIGFMPVEKPRIAIIAIIDEPHAGSIYGGAIAAPIVREVGRRALQYMNIFPSKTVTKSGTAGSASPAHH